MILPRGFGSRTVLAGVEVGGELGLGVGGEAAPGRLVAEGRGGRGGGAREGRGSRGGVAVAATRHRADRGHGVEGGQGGGGGEGGGGGDRAREVEGEPRHGEAAVRH